MMTATPNDLSNDILEVPRVELELHVVAGGFGVLLAGIAPLPGADAAAFLDDQKEAAVFLAEFPRRLQEGRLARLAHASFEVRRHVRDGVEGPGHAGSSGTARAWDGAEIAAFPDGAALKGEAPVHGWI